MLKSTFSALNVCKHTYSHRSVGLQLGIHSYSYHTQVRNRLLILKPKSNQYGAASERRVKQTVTVVGMSS